MSERLPLTAVAGLADLAEIEPGSIRQGTLPDGRKLAIYNVDGQLFVTDDVCTHGEASLSEDGVLDGAEVECSWHNGRFDVRTGEPCAMPCSQALRTWPVVVEGGQAWIEAGGET